MLSKSVAEAFAYFGDPETEETEKFVRHFDDFFDCVNVRSFSEWVTSRKPNRKLYSSPNDPRLQVMLSKHTLTHPPTHPPTHTHTHTHYYALTHCLKWLEKDFLGYLDKWQASVNSRDGFSQT